MSVNAPPSLEQAVASLLEQPVPLEIVVVNSGGGDAVARLRSFAERLRIVSHDRLLWPGEARNIGIAATTAPFIVFLACDCTAGPEWAEKRLARHRKGAPAVASALINSHPRNPFATASHLALFSRRMPKAPPHRALCYGASFARRLFHAYGVYREDLRTGEDTEFARRLPRRERPVWAPEVRAVHASPTTFVAMLSDHYARGRRMAESLTMLRRPQPHGLLIHALRSFAECMLVSLQATRGKQRLAVLCVWPLVACCIAAHTIGLAKGASAEARGVGAAREPVPKPKEATARASAR